MTPDFYWTARRMEAGKVLEEQYFPTKEERDRFVAEHSSWRRRGKICARNLERHVSPESAAFQCRLREPDEREKAAPERPEA